MPIQWTYRTSAGLLRIKRARARRDRFVLSLDEIPIGMYESPEIAADDVSMAITNGPPGLNEALEAEAPAELSEWTRHEPAAR